MNDKKRVELLSFQDWLAWGAGEGSMEWMFENKDEWILLFTSSIIGEKKALEDFKTYSNYSPSEKEKYFNYLSYDIFLRALNRVSERLKKEKAEQAINTLESGSNGKNSEMMGASVRDPEDQGQGKGNGEKAIEC